MSLKQYLFLLLIGAITSWSAFILVLFFLNPETTNALGFAFFYSSLFFALTISFALAGYLIRSLFKKVDSVSWKVNIAFRQGIFFAIVVCGSLLMLANKLFSWLNLLFLVLIMTMLEFFLINKKNNI